MQMAPDPAATMLVTFGFVMWAVFAMVALLFWIGVVVALWMFLLGKLPFQQKHLCSRCNAQLVPADLVPEETLDAEDAKLRQLAKELERRLAQKTAPSPTL
jgi:hypothetical protein